MIGSMQYNEKFNQFHGTVHDSKKKSKVMADLAQIFQLKEKIRRWLLSNFRRSSPHAKIVSNILFFPTVLTSRILSRAFFLRWVELGSSLGSRLLHSMSSNGRRNVFSPILKGFFIYAFTIIMIWRYAISIHDIVNMPL